MKFVIRTTALLLAASTAGMRPAAAQDVGVGVALHAGSLGLGGDVAVQVHEMLGLRAGGNFFPFDIDLTVSDIEYTVDLPSPQFMLLADVHPGGSAFRLTGGLLISTKNLGAIGEFTGSVDIGGQTYTGADVGTLSGEIITKEVAPYIGIGFGKPGASSVGFFLDLGVAFHGSPDVELTADGPLSTNAQFQADLEAERADFEDDISGASFYPVLSIGVSIGIM